MPFYFKRPGVLAMSVTYASISSTLTNVTTVFPHIEVASIPIWELGVNAPSSFFIFGGGFTDSIAPVLTPSFGTCTMFGAVSSSGVRQVFDCLDFRYDNVGMLRFSVTAENFTSTTVDFAYVIPHIVASNMSISANVSTLEITGYGIYYAPDVLTLSSGATCDVSSLVPRPTILDAQVLTCTFTSAPTWEGPLVVVEFSVSGVAPKLPIQVAFVQPILRPPGSTIVIPTILAGNTTLQPNQTYTIPAGLNIDGSLVVPPGTILLLDSTVTTTGGIVLNGGTLVVGSNGTTASVVGTVTITDGSVRAHYCYQLVYSVEVD
jgi:hypothetical protein